MEVVPAVRPSGRRTNLEAASTTWRLGDDLMPPWPDNEKGFFENNKIWKYNQRLLEHFDSSWDDPFLTQNWCAGHDLSDFRQTIKELINTQFGSFNLFAIKDPRLCILFPLWKDTLAEMGIESKQNVSHRYIACTKFSKWFKTHC